MGCIASQSCLLRLCQAMTPDSPYGLSASFFLNRPTRASGGPFRSRRLFFIHVGSSTGDIGNEPAAVETVLDSRSMRSGLPSASCPSPASTFCRRASCVTLDLSCEFHLRVNKPCNELRFVTAAVHRLVAIVVAATFLIKP
jgi:hypothetical protein